MTTAPLCCPHCGEYDQWRRVETSRKGFSAGKAVVGGMLLGPIGLLGGAIGKKTDTWACGVCHYQQDYKPISKI